MMGFSHRVRRGWASFASPEGRNEEEAGVRSCCPRSFLSLVQTTDNGCNSGKKVVQNMILRVSVPRAFEV